LDARSFGEVLPPLGLSKPFPVLFGMPARLLTAKKRDSSTALGVVHSSLPIQSIMFRNLTFAYNLTVTEIKGR
jgi:hypothetical protein